MHANHHKIQDIIDGLLKLLLRLQHQDASIDIVTSLVYLGNPDTQKHLQKWLSAHAQGRAVNGSIYVRNNLAYAVVDVYEIQPNGDYSSQKPLVSLDLLPPVRLLS
jgi:hypothetical protein